MEKRLNEEKKPRAQEKEKTPRQLRREKIAAERRRKVEKKKNVPQETVNHEEVVIDGMRWVKPYYHWFCTEARESWIGKELFEVMTSEFGVSNEKSRRSLERGELYIQRNNEKVSTTIIETNDCVLYRIH
ncbi:hypothetical protein EIN_504580, partial [Entamoeba invadens IP1]